MSASNVDVPTVPTRHTIDGILGLSSRREAPPLADSSHQGNYIIDTSNVYLPMTKIYNELIQFYKNLYEDILPAI